MAGEKANKGDTAKREEVTLKRWQKNQIFEKSLEQTRPTKRSWLARLFGGRDEFVFYDGPPFATGLPHYGHLLAGTIKDVIPRYQTMRDRYVRRQWGWDCHGLPLENQVEAELGLSGKGAIVAHGISRFNEAAKKSVLRYAHDWKRIIPRVGRWVDMERDYRTMDAGYTESVWWAFKRLHDKGLIYEGFKSMHLCPRCETTLSNFEVAQGYSDIKDIAVTVKLRLIDEENTSLLAWTTTAWTLPGNVAAAVNPDLVYAKVLSDGEQYYVAEGLVETLFGDKTHEIVETLPGTTLVGKSYEPPFDYFRDADLPHKERAWKVYAAPYVTLDEGTGIVHLAPAFGAEDMELAQENDIPLIHHVDAEGRFTDAVTDLAGVPVKPRGAHQETDVEIVKLLAHKELLFAKEKIEHSYPHCWRCDTPLLNYATSSWFVRVTALKDNLIAENRKIKWVPREIGENRFGDWLANARDWAISRSRFWGAPLPVWKCEECEHSQVFGSYEALKERLAPAHNRYVVMRHGGAESNAKGIMSTRVDNPHNLTKEGERQVEEALTTLREKHIDLIVASPFLRTQHTAEIIADGLGMNRDAIVYDSRIKEIEVGELDGKQVDEYHRQFPSVAERFDTAPRGGETLTELKRRAGDFLYSLEDEYHGKTILIVTHEVVINALFAVAKGADRQESIAIKSDEQFTFKTGEVGTLSFSPLPHNPDFELDVHMPYIDEVSVPCTKCSGEMQRVPEVFDCWFESGSMPYGQHHYPFENRDVFEPKAGRGFPADFIAEGLDQTRGWFYSLLVLGVALFGRSPYKAVIVNGTVLAEDGQKMSKRLKNYPDPLDVINRYGADALRYYLMSSPVVRAEDANFSEKGVGEVARKVIVRLKNVVSFYELYAEKRAISNARPMTDKVLDQWILARLNELIEEVTRGFDAYELDRASRPIAEFVDDLSTWYLRRSRERFKGNDEDDKQAALGTTRFVLHEFAKVIAPLMPFLAEDIYGRIVGIKESVHLESWPEAGRVDETVLNEMRKARSIVNEGLEARANAGIRVRQPLAKLVTNSEVANDVSLAALIADEVNVKEVVFDATVDRVSLDTTITPELKREGQVRELLRSIQDLRKKEGLEPGQEVVLHVETDTSGKELIEEFATEIKNTASLSDISFEKRDDGEEISVDELLFALSLKK